MADRLASHRNRRLWIAMIVASVASAVVVILAHAWLLGSSEFGLRTVGWIVAQTCLLTLPAAGVAWLSSRGRVRRLLDALAIAYVVGLPTLLMLEAVCFHWIGDHLLSAAMWKVITLVPGPLADQISPGMWRLMGGAVGGGVLVAVAITWVADRTARVWMQRDRWPRPAVVYGAWFSLVGLMIASNLMQPAQTLRRMHDQPSLHPLIVVGAFRTWGPTIGTWRPSGRHRLDARPPRRPRPSPERDRAGEMSAAVGARDHRLRQLSLSRTRPVDALPDIVIVVVESLRRELLTHENMPNLWHLAQQGIRCDAHFSGGNATNHGVFSLVNGLEAIWHDRPIRYTPLLNRLLSSAGYELGFFAGDDGWTEFRMDGYISAEHFDVFEVTPDDGLDSDRRATQMASRFLDRGTDDQRVPRLALLYLYATHATYHSYATDQVFQPAADSRFLYPYSASARDAVFNRYRNSGRTIDRFLAAVMRDDRIVIVTGDHGEAFLEDGTIGHGVRISEVQNMTPAVVYLPGRKPRVISYPTCHADVLPTLLSAIGLDVTDRASLDGMDLLTTSDATLGNRSFVTRDYLRDQVALIGPWTIAKDQPFAYRFSCSLRDANLAMESAPGAVVPLNRQGAPALGDGEAAVQAWWEARFNVH